jgi:hypothetical protein
MLNSAGANLARNDQSVGRKQDDLAIQNYNQAIKLKPGPLGRRIISEKDPFRKEHSAVL